MTGEQSAAEKRKFLVRVYNWMGFGLALTGLIAWFVAESPALMQAILGNQIIFFGLIIAELGAVLYLSARIAKINAKTASGLFVGYAILNGLTFSAIFAAYTQSSITTAFVVTGGMFGAMSFYGATTKKSLESWGSFFFMGLVGIIIASVVNIFLQSSAVYWISTYAGVLIFTGLTAYDTQKILAMNVTGVGAEEETKEAIMGALALYLDFINLFLMLLRIMGNRK
ncbi:MAG: Bax inhibitor-1/YccA family protein [Nitrospinae bacterium]|nr:Bax inhibitor-1/YccA family protein [Nitrospinota bacterium]